MQQATRTIPIVFTAVADPVAGGVVVDGAPGGIAITATGDQTFTLKTYGADFGANATGASFTQLNDGNSAVKDIYAGIGGGAVIGVAGQVGNITVQAQSTITANNTELSASRMRCAIGPSETLQLLCGDRAMEYLGSAVVSAADTAM